MSQPLSVRLTDATLTRLGNRARRVHLPPRTLAQRYVEEGLRMQTSTRWVRFSDGHPAGRRARLVGTGKDIWEIIAVVRDNDGDAAEGGPIPSRYRSASSRPPLPITAPTPARSTR